MAPEVDFQVGQGVETVQIDGNLSTGSDRGNGEMTITVSKKPGEAEKLENHIGERVMDVRADDKGTVNNVRRVDFSDLKRHKRILKEVEKFFLS